MSSKHKLKIVENMTDETLSKLFEDDYTVYVKPGIYAMSSRKIESLIKIAEIQKYYQCNPVRFIDDFFNIELLDSQALIVEKAWNCPNVLVVATRGIGKTTVIDLIIMAKDMLFSNFWSYIASGSGGQAEQTFTTLEKIANDNIDEMKGSTGYIFKDEVEIKNAAGDGFSHSSNGFSYTTYNGSMTMTLNSNIDSKRGFRGSVIFDECGFLSSEMIKVYGAFAIVNKSFSTGKDRDGNSIDPIRQRTFATNIPNQKFYISSASSTDTEFYRLYREFSKKQIAGNPNYCVLHIDCEVAFRPTKRGEIVKPLLSKETVETEMRTNSEKARREYYCEFTTDAGVSAIIKRGIIVRNETVRKPLLFNDTGDKKFVIAYDPARSRDNSVILVGEIYEIFENGQLDTRMRIVNCINLLDVGKKIKSPMQTPDQVEYLKEVILDYNGGADAYGNIIGVYIDAGSGGSGVNIADYLMPDWKGKDGKIHRGLIDKEYSADYVKKFPNAVDKVHLMSPSAFKSEMYESLIELMNQNKIGFTSTYDNKGYLTVFDIDEKRLEKEKQRITSELHEKGLKGAAIEEALKKELENVDSIKTKTLKLDWQDELALVNIDALKEELVNIVRKPRESGKDSFELCPEKAQKLHDDRAYCAAMAAYALSRIRHKRMIERKRAGKTDPATMVKVSKKAKKWGRR